MSLDAATQDRLKQCSASGHTATSDEHRQDKRHIPQDGAVSRERDAGLASARYCNVLPGPCISPATANEQFCRT